MLAPELSIAVSILGLASLLVALPPILRAASPAFRKQIVRAVIATPTAMALGGAVWLTATTSPGHLEAFFDGRWPVAQPASFAAPGGEAAIARAD